MQQMGFILEGKHNLINNEVSYENIFKDISISVLLSKYNKFNSHSFKFKVSVFCDLNKKFLNDKQLQHKRYSWIAVSFWLSIFAFLPLRSDMPQFWLLGLIMKKLWAEIDEVNIIFKVLSLWFMKACSEFNWKKILLKICNSKQHLF